MADKKEKEIPSLRGQPDIRFRAVQTSEGVKCVACAEEEDKDDEAAVWWEEWPASSSCMHCQTTTPRGAIRSAHLFRR